MRLIVQRILIAVSLAASAVFFIPSPAQAGGIWIRICSYIELSGGILIPDDCHWIELPIFQPEEPWPPGCPDCFPAFDIWEDFIDPAVVDEFNDYFAKGFGLLVESHQAQDPKEAAELREASIPYFLTAARLIEKHEVNLENVGWADPETGKFFEDADTQPLLDVFGKELAAGTTMFQDALFDPQPDPPIEAGLAHYDTAYEALAKLVTV